MNFAVLGINHKTAEIRIREKYAFLKSKHLQILSNVAQNNFIKSCVLVVTCNRTELYFEYTDFFNLQQLYKILNVEEQDIDKFYIFNGKEALTHLLEVVCGLDSQIIGEQEIFHQVKSAYGFAKSLGYISKNFNFLFQKVFHIAKKVRSLTDIQKGSLSYGSIVYKLICEVFSDDKEIDILIIGTGKMAELMLKYLKDNNFKITIFSTKHYDKAKNLAKLYNTQVAEFCLLKSKLCSVDVIITATVSPHCIIKTEDVADLNRQILIFDLSVPRNVESSISNLSFVKLYTIDDLNGIREDVYKKRLSAVVEAKYLIDYEVEKLCLQHIQLRLVQDLAS